MTQPEPKVSAFTCSIGRVDGSEMIVVQSTGAGVTHNNVFAPQGARQLAQHLQALADHLDPPKSEWQAVEVSPDAMKLAARTDFILQKAQRRAQRAKKAAKRSKR